MNDVTRRAAKRPARRIFYRSAHTNATPLLRRARMAGRLGAASKKRLQSDAFSTRIADPSELDLGPRSSVWGAGRQTESVEWSGFGVRASGFTHRVQQTCPPGRADRFGRRGPAKIVRDAQFRSRHQARASDQPGALIRQGRMRRSREPGLDE